MQYFNSIYKHTNKIGTIANYFYISLFTEGTLDFVHKQIKWYI